MELEAAAKAGPGVVQEVAIGSGICSRGTAVVVDSVASRAATTAEVGWAAVSSKVTSCAAG